VKPLAEQFSDEELAELSFQGFRDRVIRHSGKKNPTVRDFINVSGRGTVKEHTMFCGSPKQVADQMRNGSPRQPATGLCWQPLISREPMMMWYDCLCRNCSAAACFKRSTPARHCATIWD
jgi:hypothetical protein